MSRKPFAEPGFYKTADGTLTIYVNGCNEQASIVTYVVISNSCDTGVDGSSKAMSFNRFNEYRFQHAIMTPTRLPIQIPVDLCPAPSDTDSLQPLGQNLPSEAEQIVSLTCQRDGWMRTAEQAQRGSDYYRGLLCEIGVMLGKEAFTADDGGVHDSVLCAKVPELVKAALDRLKGYDSLHSGHKV